MTSDPTAGTHSTANADRTAVVLAGGYSTRFGDTDKALAEIDGRPMLARVVARVGAVVDSVVVSCRDDQRAAFAVGLDGIDDAPIRFVTDPEPDGGPLVGIVSAFEAVDSQYAVVVACDMPFVDPAFIEFLFSQAGGHDAVVPELDDGHRQPTQAVYRVDRTVAVADERLAAGTRSLRGLLDALETVVVPAETVLDHTDRQSLTDINTRERFESVTGSASER
ncbi:molybdenum cofactor guanylyltransferase [Halonotius roseus]|uniref:Probable molybdenum cofactor guanylyltransferase n=1 Tax=Halonotius roseus TaxID=2511997 RepID=A0A544QKY7_9EURY|nr:molybdenum cofactor guanylyltransferase [Halonotius roseus]TQQ78987.1 molybdenum cofactor guanylyltransferase [Halonotius roseus]